MKIWICIWYTAYFPDQSLLNPLVLYSSALDFLSLYTFFAAGVIYYYFLMLFIKTNKFFLFYMIVKDGKCVGAYDITGMSSLELAS